MTNERYLISDEVPEVENQKPLGFFQRQLRKIGSGSLGLTVINIVLCGITGTFFWYPVVFRTYGLYPSFFIITGFVLINYLMCYFIYYASHVSDCNCYLMLVRRYIGPNWEGVAKFTYLMDYFSVYVIGYILCWSIFAYLLYYWGYITDSDFKDIDKMKLYDYHLNIVILRTVVVVVGLLVSIPLFMKEEMNKLKVIFFGFLAVIIANILYLSIDLKQFREYYIEHNQYSVTNVKPLSFDSFRYIFIFMTSYYIQSNLLTMKNDTRNPTLPRMLATIKTAHVFFLLFAVSFGFYGYYCLGDVHTSDLFMLRKSFEGKQYEQVYRGILVLMGVFYVLYMSFFNISLRTFINNNFTHKFSKNTINLVPVTMAAILAIAYPNIVNFLSYNALLVCLLNGFIFPILIVKKIYIEKGRSRFIIWSLNLLCFLFVIVGAISFAATINDDFFSHSS
jgi:hypothetical protein